MDAIVQGLIAARKVSDVQLYQILNAVVIELNKLNAKIVALETRVQTLEDAQP
jgi:hypothetical protein